MERVADYIVRKLNQEGIEHIFIVNGRGILYLTDAVARSSKMIGISTYHEQGASFAAMAYADSGNCLSACMISTGCASTNAVTACLCAFQDNLPVVFVSGNNIRNETVGYTGIPIRTYGSQETDIINTVKPITKYAKMLVDEKKVVYEVEKALHIAKEGRMGPVWIDVPLDVQNMRIDEEKMEHFVVSNSDCGIDENCVNSVACDLAEAERPVILVGGGAANPETGKEIKKLVEKIHVPVVFSPKASDVYGTFNELSIGAVGSIGGSRAGNFTVQNADYLLVLGSKLCSQETGMKSAFAREAKVVVVDIDKAEHTKAGVHIEKLINADVKDFLVALNEIVTTKVSLQWIETCKHWKDIFSIKNELFIQNLYDNNQMDIYILSDILSGVLSEDVTIITDAGFEELIIPSSISYRDGQRCLFPAAQGAMGYAIPAIIGAHFSGRKNIICIVGDGSFMMNMQELGIISSYNINVKILVINNNMYSVIRKRQKDLFRNRTIGNDPSDGLPAPDFGAIAKSVGIKYNRIESIDEFVKCAGNLCETEEGTCLYEIMCIPDQKYLHESYAVNEKRKIEHRPIEDMAPFLDRAIINREMIVKTYNQ